MVSPKFSSSNVFHNELKKRISNYFKEIGKSPTGNGKLFVKAGILTLSFLLTYTHLVFFQPILPLAIAESMIIGILTACIGFNIMHDGAHGSFSKYPIVNDLAGLSLNFLGANLFMWKTKHNVIHHAYTNIDGVDDDIQAAPILRLCESQKHYSFHRYQHIYFWFAYSFLYLFWIFFTDFKKYFTRKVGNMPLKKMAVRDHISFWGFKLFYIILFMAIPIHTWGFLPWLAGFLIFSMTAGLLLSIVFQLAHTVEETSFPVMVSNQINEDWAVHQLKTTANFATKNKFISWMVGGLNYQVEHHLFPKISHVHYPEISKIVKNTCSEFGVPYLEHPKMRWAINSHINHLRSLGKREAA